MLISSDRFKKIFNLFRQHRNFTATACSKVSVVDKKFRQSKK